MSGRGKRLWAPHLDFKGAYDEVLSFLKSCEKHQLPVQLSEPTLYRAYALDGVWPTADGQDLSRFLRFGYANDPAGDRAKIAISRLLSIAVKAHFFLAPDARVPSEPTVFVCPDLAQPGTMRYGIIYPLDVPASHGPGKQRSIVVAEWDLSMTAHRRPQVPRGDEFPVVLQSSNRTWLLKSRWEALRDSPQMNKVWFEPSTSPARRRLIDAIKQHTDRDTFPYGTLLDYPIHIKDDTALTGAMWAPGVKSWFLPHGFDVDSVKSYLSRLATLSQEDRMSHRWWERREENPRKPIASRAAAAPK